MPLIWLALQLPFLTFLPGRLHYFQHRFRPESESLFHFCHHLQCKRGHLESEFLKHLVDDLNQLEVASSQVYWMPHYTFNCNVSSFFHNLSIGASVAYKDRACKLEERREV